MRHQCIIYRGAPSEHLKSIASALVQNLRSNNRCLYLNSPSMVAGMRCAVSALGVEIEREIERGALIFSSDQTHLRDGLFDVPNMLTLLEKAIDEAVASGFTGLWASGDMTWEFGGRPELKKLIEYEEQLDELFSRRANLSGICQYHADSLPLEAIKEGLRHHKTTYMNETLSRANKSYRSAS